MSFKIFWQVIWQVLSYMCPRLLVPVYYDDDVAGNFSEQCALTVYAMLGKPC
jgi:hypothetical protein